MAKRRPKPLPTIDELFTEIAERMRYTETPPANLVLPAVGEKADLGNLRDAVVIAWAPDRRHVILEYNNEGEIKDALKNCEPTENIPLRKQCGYSWNELRFPALQSETPIALPDDVRYSTFNRDIDGILHMVESSGIETETDYQRPLEWTLEDKQRLIQTILEHGPIGTLTFNRRAYSFKGPLHEVVDGKQRLTTLVDFKNGKFPYEGRYFWQLHPADRGLFRMTPVPTLILEEADELTILRVFYRVNRGGRRMADEHLAKIRAEIIRRHGSV